MKFILLTLFCVSYVLAEEKTSYEGYKLLNIFPKTQKQIDLIGELQHKPDFDLWSRIKGDGAKVSLAPSAFQKYEALFRLYKIEYDIVHHNLQELFDEEQKEMSKREVGESKNIAGKYARHTEINNFISDLASAQSIVSTYVAGKSANGRDLRVAVIKTASSRRKIWIDCGIHAREWVSPSTCVWIIDRLVAEYNSNVAATVALLNYYEFHILPVVNPDGYEYSHTTTRLWRKNRKTNTGSSCIGVDLNRNYGFQWMTGGSSSDPCSDTYAGPSRDSELETQAVEGAINAYKGTWDAFLTIHSYGKWWFTPYGYTASILPPDYTDQNAKAQIGANALMAVYNDRGWVTGSSAKILYVASGGSEDWAYGTSGIKYSYCIELRPGQTGTDSAYGFQLPESRAPLAGEETYVGIKAFLNSIKP